MNILNFKEKIKHHYHVFLTWGKITFSKLLLYLIIYIISSHMTLLINDFVLFLPGFRRNLNMNFLLLIFLCTWKSIFRLVKCIHIYTYWLYFLQIGLFIHIYIYMHIFIYMYSSSSPSRLLPIFESTHSSLILGLGEVVVLLLKVSISN